MKLPAYAILLAGGYGTRFWPLSRRAKPKQFLALTGNKSLLQQTYGRLLRLFPPSRIYVVGNAEHRRLLRQQLPRVPPGRLLLEPVGRNTAAAIALAAAHIRRHARGDAVLGVFPADHAIRDQARFLRIARAALAAAAEEVMVVLGIPPTSPHTGYGYIERGRARGRAGGQPVFIARRFTEKPDAAIAARYVRGGRHYWNSGMFFWRLSTFDALLHRHLRATYAALQDSPAGAALRRAYSRLENISVDYALAEPAAAKGRARMLPAKMGWSDLGTWSAVYDWRAKARGENQMPAAHFVLDARGSLVEAKGKFAAAVGVDDLIVVETPDALLLCSHKSAQDVGKVVHYLEKKGLRRLL
ncbi:MAG TPA: sugar phosphate nucleotidyltransferase [Candidatus Acidoferrales bacterium]|nr:sugar phosphate nucleotidyltransferase [Candidatus Acidoferrales bacterium]